MWGPTFQRWSGGTVWPYTFFLSAPNPALCIWGWESAAPSAQPAGAGPGSASRRRQRKTVRPEEEEGTSFYSCVVAVLAPSLQLLALGAPQNQPLSCTPQLVAAASSSPNICYSVSPFRSSTPQHLSNEFSRWIFLAPCPGFFDRTWGLFFEMVSLFLCTLHSSSQVLSLSPGSTTY